MMRDILHNLGVGVFGLSPGLVSLLDSIGLNYREVIVEESALYSYSIYIVHRPLNRQEQHWLETQQHSGNKLAVLFTSESSIQPANIPVQNRYCRSVHSPDLLNGPLSHLCMIDCYAKVNFYGGKQDIHGICFVDKKNSQAFEQSIYLGIPIEAAFYQFSYTRKVFPSPTGHQPNELVSRSHIGHLQHLVRYALEQLFYSVDLPYLTKWRFPTAKPIITLRIDSDFGTQESLRTLYGLANEYSAILTTFLHVKAHEDWLDWFAQWSNHEHALHGYEHAHISSSYPLYQDVENGYQAMADAGMTPKGYAAPYGIWSLQLSKVLDTYPFSYSSEFTHGYDGLPYWSPKSLPNSNDAFNKRLQIPVHPICTGSLHRYQATESHFIAYFKRYMDIQHGLQQPLMLYHHPLQPGFASIEFILKYAQELGLQWLSYSDWCAFWTQRATEQCNIYYHRPSRQLHSKIKPSLFYELKQDTRDFAIIKPNDWDSQKVFPMNTLTLRKIHCETMADEKFLQNRFSNKWRLLKETIIQNRNRIRL
ncbi:MAG: hypothetical protein CL672_04625 [Balneola sp.]|nr:hypothetical protein [Balneola sp.]